MNGRVIKRRTPLYVWIGGFALPFMHMRGSGRVRELQGLTLEVNAVSRLKIDLGMPSLMATQRSNKVECRICTSRREVADRLLIPYNAYTFREEKSKSYSRNQADVVLAGRSPFHARHAVHRVEL